MDLPESRTLLKKLLDNEQKLLRIEEWLHGEGLRIINEADPVSEEYYKFTIAYNKAMDEFAFALSNLAILKAKYGVVGKTWYSKKK